MALIDLDHQTSTRNQRIEVPAGTRSANACIPYDMVRGNSTRVFETADALREEAERLVRKLAVAEWITHFGALSSRDWDHTVITIAHFSFRVSCTVSVHPTE